MAQVAHGRATGNLSLSWGTGTRVEGAVRFFNAEFESLVGRNSSLRSVVVGKVTGRFDFASSNFQSLDDLNGVLEARLAQSQALQLPVLNVLVPFVAPGRSSTSFQSGHIDARLSRGYFRIQRLALMSPAIRLMVSGNAGLNGRLDLEVTAKTGDAGINTTALNLIAQRIPAIGPVPVALIARASSLLANQVVHLRVTGTVSSPNVRVDPISLLTEEAARLFLDELPRATAKHDSRCRRRTKTLISDQAAVKRQRRGQESVPEAHRRLKFAATNAVKPVVAGFQPAAFGTDSKIPSLALRPGLRARPSYPKPPRCRAILFSPHFVNYRCR